MRSVHYLAFGSNLLTARLQARCDSAQALGAVQLHGWRLAFHKRGADKSGKGDIIPGDPADRIFGVVYRLAEAQLSILDRFEGPGYEHAMLEVELNGDLTQCVCYRAIPDAIEPDLKPYDWYQALILAGLLEHGADSDYIDAVRGQPYVPDPRPFRASRQRALAALAAFGGTHPHHAERLRLL
jgi:hypothetical protein